MKHIAAAAAAAIIIAILMGVGGYAQVPLTNDILATCPQGHANLAAILACAPKLLGAAPEKFDTPFLVVSVSPISGGECLIDLATNGMDYRVSGNMDAGWCNHLPPLHSLVWGRVRHSALATFLRQSNALDVPSDYVDLVYAESHKKPKTAPYVIDSASAIGADYGGGTPDTTAPEVRAVLNDPVAKNQLAENSKVSNSSPAAATALLTDGHVPTQEELKQDVKDGTASYCVVITTPPSAELYIDGNLEPVINFIPLESKKYPSAPLSLTMGGWETRGKSAIPAM